LYAHLVFREPYQQCAGQCNEISALGAELVFREVPGKLVQRRRHAQRFRVAVGLQRALLDPVRSRVFPVPLPPTGLGFVSPLLLAVRLATGVLSISDPRIRPEPPPADPARPLPRVWHADVASSSPLAARPGSLSSRVGRFW
jgi:hypothetical protein